MQLDPVTMGAAASITVAAVLDAIKGAAAYLGSRADISIRERDAVHLALRLLGSVQFETRRNLERARYMVRCADDHDGSGPSVPMGQFDFAVSSAVLPDLCRVAPNPLLLDSVASILGALKRIDIWQRRVTETLLPTEQTHYFGRAAGFAKDLLDKGACSKFNGLNAIGLQVGRAQFPNEWTEAAHAACFPADIDPAAAINHDLI